MDRIQRLVQGMQGGGPGGPPGDTPQVDTAEQIYISSLALLKMLKHGAAIGARAWQQRWAHGKVAVLWCTKLPLLYAKCCSSRSLSGRAGVPMEVMGLMLGEFVDDYTVKVRAARCSGERPLKPPAALGPEHGMST
jgi:26S proteasome regulatory subunit N11